MKSGESIICLLPEMPRQIATMTNKPWNRARIDKQRMRARERKKNTTFNHLQHIDSFWPQRVGFRAHVNLLLCIANKRKKNSTCLHYILYACSIECSRETKKFEMGRGKKCWNSMQNKDLTRKLISWSDGCGGMQKYVDIRVLKRVLTFHETWKSCTGDGGSSNNHHQIHASTYNKTRFDIRRFYAISKSESNEWKNGQTGWRTDGRWTGGRAIGWPGRTSKRKELEHWTKIDGMQTISS